MYLGWLPVTYNMELNFCKTVFKALDNEDWPPYLRLELREPAEFKLNLAVPEHSGAFQDSTTRLSTTPPPQRPSKLARREPPSYANAKSFKYPFSNLACDPLFM